jgi:hypothetical protein
MEASKLNLEAVQRFLTVQTKAASMADLLDRITSSLIFYILKQDDVYDDTANDISLLIMLRNFFIVVALENNQELDYTRIKSMILE